MTELPLSSAERDVFTVSRLNREVKTLLEGSFPLLWVEGEISNLSRPASGHMYFTLKDSQAQIRCALFRGQQRGLAAPPRDGLRVLLRARVTLYEGRGDFQLIVESLEEAGEGALRRAFEQLRNRLAAEGLFDPVHKRPLPRIPKRIGVITSPSGAVIHDILTTLRRRFPAIPVLLHPVPVQGEGAGEKIADMIRLAGKRRECDVLIVARGGGSLEDLWAFNEEVVARAIHASPIPVVCGVGHETDVTIADFAADARAPTPTAAAELLSPNQRDVISDLVRQERHLARRMRDRLHQAQQHLDHLGARLVHPRERLARLAGLFVAQRRHLMAATLSRLSHGSHVLSRLQSLLMQHNPGHRLHELAMQASQLHLRLRHAVNRTVDRKRERLARVTQALDTLSPLATLARGYCILESANGILVRDVRQLATGERLHARLAHGQIDCLVEKLHEDRQ